MPACLKRHSTLFVVYLLTMITGYAQTHSIGTAYSFSGAGITYRYEMKEDCFINADIRAELGEVFMNRTDRPGISASITTDFILAEWKSSNGNDLRCYAGPGVAIGSAKDLKTDYGYYFGLKGRIGIECMFIERKICISAGICPILGTHVIVMDESINMRLYINGLINSLLPEIGIRYLF